MALAEAVTPLPEGPDPIFSSAPGPESLNITFTVENDTQYARREIVGFMVPFPEGLNGIDESELANLHMQLTGGREMIGLGYNVFVTGFSTTIPWPAAYGVATTSDPGAIIPGSVQITLYWENGSNYGKRIITDNGSGGFTDPAVTSGTVNYVTGAVSITFASSFAPAPGKKVRLTYRCNEVKLPTQWLVVRRWPNGQVRQAKAWAGKTGGVGVDIPAKITSITPNAGPAITPEFTRGFFSIGRTAGYNAANLPTYTQSAAVTLAMATGTPSFLTSQVLDTDNTVYDLTMLDSSNYYEEDILEDPALNSGKGWMKVVRRRGYHTAKTANAKFGSMTRDLFSLTWYLYIGHQERLIDLEVRLGNDYQGADPVEHTFTENLSPTPTGTTRTFTGSMTHVFNSTDFDYGWLRKGRVHILQDGVEVAYDDNGDGNLNAVNDSGVSGTVNYQTGAISITYAANYDPPAANSVIACTYNTYYIRIGLATGVDTLNYNLPTKPSQYGVHVRVGAGGTTAIYEGWDSAASSGVGQLVPYSYETTYNTQVVGTPLSGTTTGNIATNLVPGTVGFFVSTTTAGASSVVFCRDNGSGTLAGRGVTTGTINYVTGAFSITFSSTPSVGENLYATYGRTTSARPISGTINYSTRDISVTTSQSVPASTPVYVSYIRNNTTKDHDPNMHPLGATGFNMWAVALRNDTFTDVQVEAKDTYAAAISNSGVTHYLRFLSGAGYTFGTISAGGVASEQYDHEHMQDGTAVSRMIRAYCGSGATTLENNTWAARKLHPITAIPTMDAYNATRAINLVEGAISFVSPEQKLADWQMPARAATEDILRDDSQIGNSSSDNFSAITAWNNGVVTLQGQVGSAPTRSARSHMGWRENKVTGLTAGGAPRNGLDHSSIMYYSQAWQAVRYFYHAASYPLCRPGTMLWNVALAHKWSTRSYRKIIDQQTDSWGVLPGLTPDPNFRQYKNFPPHNQQFLGRGWKYGYGRRGAVTTNGSTTIQLLDYEGVSSTGANGAAFFFNEGAGKYFSLNGSTRIAGMRRIAIQGSTRTYNVQSIVYNGSRWVVTLDAAFDGPTTTSTAPAYYGLFCDARPGQDLQYPRNDPRSFPIARIGCGEPSKQHGAEGDATSHQSAEAAFEAWNVTGSWHLWDAVRHRIEWNITGYKDQNVPTGEIYRGQIRSNAWILRAILTGYMSTKDLVGRPGFEFLTDPVYGSVKDRCEEYFHDRWTWWFDISARGLMDPNNTVAINGKTRIANAVVSNLTNSADWDRTSHVGSLNPAYGGNGTLSEAQLKFGADGFHYMPVWEIGYLTPWVGVMFREFRYDSTLVTAPNRQLTLPFWAVSQLMFEGYANFLVDYGFIEGQTPVPNRGYPGFHQLQIPGLMGHTMPEYGGANRGLPLTSLANPATARIPLSTFSPTWESIAWPALDDDDSVTQAYYLRGGSKLIPSDSDAADTIGYPIPGVTVPTTTFENGLLYPGLASTLTPEPTVANPPDYRNIRAPARPETMTSVGVTWNSEPLNTVCMLSLSMAARWHTDAEKRSRAGDLMNRLLWQGIAFSLLNGTYAGVNQFNYSKATRIEGGVDNPFIGPVTGDFPYDTSSSNTQPTDRWWDSSYVFRRKVTSGTAHTVHVADRDIAVIRLNDYSIHTKLAKSDKSDVRVVRQDSLGGFTEAKSTVRVSPSGSVYLFFAVPAALETGQSIQSLLGEEWFIYYYNPVSTASQWDNVVSIDGPFAQDQFTEALWNQRGNISTDAGTNNWPLQTVAPFYPTYEDGPFASAIGFDKDNFTVAFSDLATALATSGDPNRLTNQFTIECFFNIRAYDMEQGRSVLFGILSIANSSSYPFVMYVDNANRSINAVASTGSTSGYTANAVSAMGPVRQVIDPV